MREEGDEFDRRAYVQQVASGLRRRRTPEEFLEEIYFREASGDYFDTKDFYDGMIDATETADERRALREEWRLFSTAYRNQHPLFDQVLSDPERDRRRQVVIDEMSGVVASAPDAAPDGMEELLAVYDDYRLRRDGLGGLRSAAALDRKEQLAVAFIQVSADVLRRHPGLRSFYDRVLRPEIAEADDIEEEQAA